MIKISTSYSLKKCSEMSAFVDSFFFLSRTLTSRYTSSYDAGDLRKLMARSRSANSKNSKRNYHPIMPANHLFLLNLYKRQDALLGSRTSLLGVTLSLRLLSGCCIINVFHEFVTFILTEGGPLSPLACIVYY